MPTGRGGGGSDAARLEGPAAGVRTRAHGHWTWPRPRAGPDRDVRTWHPTHRAAAPSTWRSPAPARLAPEGQRGEPRGAELGGQGLGVVLAERRPHDAVRPVPDDGEPGEALGLQVGHAGPRRRLGVEGAR